MAAPASLAEYEFEWAPSPAAASSSSGCGSPPAKIIDSLSPPLIAMFAVAGAAFLIIIYARLLSRHIRRLFRRRRLRSAASELGSQSPPRAFPFAGESYSDYLLSPYGLDDAAIKTLPLSLFSKSKAKQTNRDCAVCLFEFDDGDWLRTLPLCSHAFHVDCIDIWLRSHATCPLCRAAVSFRFDSPFIPMRAARIRPSFDDLLLEPLPPPTPPPMPPDLETAASPSPAMIPEKRRDFFLKRSYSFGFERSEAAEMVMEAAAATTSPPWRHRQYQSHHHRGLWSYWWPSPFGGGGSSSASRSARGFSLRGMKSPFTRRWGFVPLADGGAAATASASASRRSRSVASPSAVWMGRALGGFSSSRMRCGDPKALLSPERLNRR